jgi:hypothetical protein
MRNLQAEKQAKTAIPALCTLPQLAQLLFSIEQNGQLRGIPTSF